MSDYLKNINCPDQLKDLKIEELGDLAEEVRQFILGSVSKTGGHLASNLGIVELTVALHYVFNFSSDKLLWDVGHQCYAHKILTGRKEDFSTLRQEGGISGFPNPEESKCDQFVVGHAGTAIATAVGMALGHKKKEEKIAAVVGDASVVNGLSFEGLNNLGLVKRQLLIVLNDNSMAIDATQGAVAKYFSRIRLSQTYEDLRDTTTNILEHLPVVGKGMEVAVEKLKKTIRMVLPASQLFESLNIPYFGPVYGHDMASMVHLLKAMEHLDRPAILHVFTQKGKGFLPAEKQLSKYHSTEPFKVNSETVEPEKKCKVDTNPRFTKIFGESLIELAQKDERIVAITSAMCGGTGLGDFREKFPDRFYDVGIAESAAVDIAAGMAKSGLRPVVCIYSTFLQRGFDQIYQEIAMQGLPVVFCIDRAGLVGLDGATHHGLLDIGFLRMMPEITVIAPSDGPEVKLALEFALSCQGPVCLRYPRDSVPCDDFDRSACSINFQMGKSVVVKSGTNCGIVVAAYGSMLTEALKAEEILSAEGIEIDIINARFAAPIDEKIFVPLKRGRAMITIEEHSIDCGFGSGVLEAASKLNIDKPIKIIGVPKRFIRHNIRENQLVDAGVNADKIVETVREIIKEIPDQV